MVCMSELDNAMDVLDALEERKRGAGQPPGTSGQRGRVLVGKVEHYYEKAGVAAVKLEGTLRIGDIVELGDEEEAVRQRIASMQIDRQDVEEAYNGDFVGIKTKYRIAEGVPVYKIE